MVGTLCRYLRLMGYDTISANDLPGGDPKEDTRLLAMSHDENRIILTRDAALAQRGTGKVVYMQTTSLEDQLLQLLDSELIVPELRLTRCSLCNSLLVRISDNRGSDLPDTAVFPVRPEKPVLWCPHCRKAYWEGSHTVALRTRIKRIAHREPE
jgi:uncharacterized protein with PIN domain